MTRMWVVVGDSTSSGGRVVTGSPFTDIDGAPVARIGDSATCPSHSGTFPIVDGDPTTEVDGQPVALHGSRLACGCVVLAVRQTRAFLDRTLGSAAGELASAGIAYALGNAPRQPFDEAFVLESEDGSPMAGRSYRIVCSDGRIEPGVTDEAGRTHLLKSEYAQSLSLELAEEGP